MSHQILKSLGKEAISLPKAANQPSTRRKPVSENFLCAACEYKTNRKCNFDKHLASVKHQLITKIRDGEKLDEVIEPDCLDDSEEQITESIVVNEKTPFDLKFLIVEIVKSNTELQRQCAEFQRQCADFQRQNQDMQKTVIDVCQKMQTASNVTTSPGNANNNMTTTTVISQNNNNNKTFNMQVFLNEHCKDAMNLTEFVDSIDLNLDDLESVGKAGFVDGISNIIIGKLRDTEVHLRPIHCSDAKREVMYIKENNKWNKEGPKNENMRKFVQYIERKNIKLLGEYQQKYPESRDYESPLNDHYVQLSLTATCATPEHLDKVISRIAKEVLIDK
jgi:hypothetical protein